MKLTRVETAKAPVAIGPYSQAIKVGGFVYCSGQIPLVAETGELVAGGIVEQTHQCLQNLQQVLMAASTDFSAVVKTTIYLTNLDNFALVNEVYSGYCSGIAPARVTVEVSGLPKGALVEIDAIACVSEG